MLCRADSIGVFQVESRAQMGLLPRLQPRRFYDLVVQIALVRPGPIQGGAVHPFVRRKLGKEPVEYAHPKLIEPLERTLGIPVFQEQLMQMAMAIGNCSGEDADLLRRAMGSKRGHERIESLREKLYVGMAENGLTGDVADDIYAKIQAFANFGFAESHCLSFGLLVYASSWIKLHYPAAFLAGLLRAQPMGFYSPASLTADAKRHGVEVRRPDILRSGADALLEPIHDGAAPGHPDCRLRRKAPARAGRLRPERAHEYRDHRRDGGVAVRLGLAAVRGIGAQLAARIVAAREAADGFRGMEDLVRRVGLTTAQLEALATAGAFEPFGLSSREALWRAGAAAQDRAEFLAGTVVAVQPPLFTDPTAFETLAADLWATGISPDDHPVRHLRPRLDDRGVLAAAALREAENGRRIEVAGLVTHRQRPATASGITFMNLEDEPGLVNVICATASGPGTAGSCATNPPSSCAASWNVRPRGSSTCSPTRSNRCGRAFSTAPATSGESALREFRLREQHAQRERVDRRLEVGLRRHGRGDADDAVARVVAVRERRHPQESRRPPPPSPTRPRASPCPPEPTTSRSTRRSASSSCRARRDAP